MRKKLISVWYVIMKTRSSSAMFIYLDVETMSQQFRYANRIDFIPVIYQYISIKRQEKTVKCRKEQHPFKIKDDL